MKEGDMEEWKDGRWRIEDRGWRARLALLCFSQPE
jgi:hypothetical protein